MTMLWAAIFGDTVILWYEKNMLEEFVMCVQIYLGAVFIYKLKK